MLNPKVAHFGKQFQPTGRRLRKGDAVILDVGPVVGRIACDMGYSCSLGLDGDEEFHAARMALEPYRELILTLVRQGRSQAQIYNQVDELITGQGYENIHSYYPGSVIAHKVGRGTRRPAAHLPHPRVQPAGDRLPVRSHGSVRAAATHPPGAAVERDDQPALPTRTMGRRTAHRQGQHRRQMGRTARRHRRRGVLARRRPAAHPVLARRPGRACAQAPTAAAEPGSSHP